MDNIIIDATPDENGRIIIELYGKEFEIDDSMFDGDGVALAKFFGQNYEIHRPATKTQARKRKAAKKEEEVEVEIPDGEEES